MSDDGSKKDKPGQGGSDSAGKKPKRRRRRRRRGRGGANKAEGGQARESSGAKGGASEGSSSGGRRRRRGSGGARNDSSKSKRGGRRRRRGRKPKSYLVLGRSVEEMTERYGEPETRSDTLMIWTDGKDERSAYRIECMVIEEKVKTARIVPATPSPMSRDQILRTVGRYNGGNVERPQASPHTIAGGASAIEFKDDYWAFVQTDSVGCVYGIKIWQEPLDGGVMTR